MALNDDIMLLSNVPLFADISEDKLRLIAFGAERRRIFKGQELFREGGAGRLRLCDRQRQLVPVEGGFRRF